MDVGEWKMNNAGIQYKDIDNMSSLFGQNSHFWQQETVPISNPFVLHTGIF